MNIGKIANTNFKGNLVIGPNTDLSLVNIKKREVSPFLLTEDDKFEKGKEKYSDLSSDELNIVISAGDVKEIYGFPNDFTRNACPHKDYVQGITFYDSEIDADVTLESTCFLDNLKTAYTAANAGQNIDICI
ncbi:MAG: hypothetical protein IJ877_03435 [Candidatus Gastranaerophilales bacterium]|nr:hypothetical protein [Candidatus Gastranaerophilales bacterium]